MLTRLLESESLYGPVVTQEKLLRSLIENGERNKTPVLLGDRFLEECA